MTYATLDDLLKLASRERLIELTDRADPAEGDVDDGLVDWALTQADALIDARLGARYALPLDPVPSVLVRVAAVIAYHDLHIEEVPVKVADDYRRALAWLDRVAGGEALLPGTGGGAEPERRQGTGVEASGPPRTFSRTTLSGF